MTIAAPPRRQPKAWSPTPDEVEQIVREMRPIIADFARRAARDCGFPLS